LIIGGGIDMRADEKGGGAGGGGIAMRADEKGGGREGI